MPPQMGKKCCTCKKVKSLRSFGKNKSIADGFSRKCKRCESSSKRKAYLRPVTALHAICATCKVSKREIEFSKGANTTGLDSSCMTCQSRRKRIYAAKKEGIEIDVEYVMSLKYPDTCPILGTKFLSEREGDKNLSPSFDRIDPTSNRANTLKNNASLDELKKLIAFLEGRSLPGTDVSNTWWQKLVLFMRRLYVIITI
jgi:hypothetical protein